jgi:hypothetical protein
MSLRPYGLRDGLRQRGYALRALGQFFPPLPRKATLCRPCGTPELPALPWWNIAWLAGAKSVFGSSACSAAGSQTFTELVRTYALVSANKFSEWRFMRGVDRPGALARNFASAA